MISGFDIVCLSTSSWESPYGSRQELMSRFAGTNRVLFVEYQANWLHPIRYRRFRRSAGWIPGRLRPLSEQLWVYTPPLGISGGTEFGVINQWNQWRLVRALRAVLKQLGFSRRLLWIYPPYAAPLVGRLGEVFSVYHCIEAFHLEKRSPRYRRWMARHERRVTLRCDLVMACSSRLCEHLAQWRNDVSFMPPGVDLNTFDSNRATWEPEEFQGIPRPVLGYVGSLDERIDLELLEHLARTFPHGTLMLVGRVHERFHPGGLQRLANVCLVGQKPKEDLAAFIQQMDVCLIPYRLTPFTEVILPLKLFEYLAMGKPVVSTWLPELAPYASAVRLTKDRDEFTVAVQAILNDGERQSANNSQLVQLATWDDRIERISTAIEERLVNRLDPSTREIQSHRAQICQRFCKRLAQHVQSVLDIGCGQGNLTQQIATWMPNALVYACDLSFERVRGGNSARRVHQFVADGCRVPCSTSQLDLVILWSVLDHIQDFAGALRETRRVLRPGGWLLLQSNLFNRFVKLDPPDPLKHYQYFSYGSLLRALQRAGFEVSERVGNGFPCQLVSSSWGRFRSPYGLTKRLAWLFGPLRFLGRCVPRWAFDVTILARRSDSR